MTRGPVHILDDDPAVLKSLDRLIRSAGYDTMPYDTSFALLEAAPRLSGCVLLDIRMPGVDGLEVHRRLAGGNAPVVLMTGHGDIGMAVEALKAGAVDFLEKPFSEERLFGAIDAALVKSSVRATQGLADEAAKRIGRLSPREREVLNALVQGEAHKVVAHRLGISVRTVELHRARMLRRLGTRHLADAIKLAVLAELRVESAETLLGPTIQ
jgi:two-component system response regulator FixJ